MSAALQLPQDDRSPGQPSTGALLEIRDAQVTLGRARILEGVGLTVEPQRWTAIVGPNGAGKSTLLKAVAGLVPYRGRVLLDGRSVTSLNPRERAREIGYAPQTPVMPDAMLVREYVQLGRTPFRGLLSGPRAEDARAVDEAIERLDLGPLTDRPLRSLSGGERQRAVLARVLAQQPRVLLLDEPTSALDLGHAQQVLELVDRLRREDGMTVVSTLHDLVLAGQYAEHLVLMNGGRVVAEGSPRDVLTAESLQRHYGVHAEVQAGPTGVRVHPVRPALHE